MSKADYVLTEFAELHVVAKALQLIEFEGLQLIKWHFRLWNFRPQNFCLIRDKNKRVLIGKERKVRLLEWSLFEKRVKIRHFD